MTKARLKDTELDRFNVPRSVALPKVFLPPSGLAYDRLISRSRMTKTWGFLSHKSHSSVLKTGRIVHKTPML